MLSKLLLGNAARQEPLQAHWWLRPCPEVEVKLVMFRSRGGISLPPEVEVGGKNSY